MTTDERLDRLTERHEALTINLELLTAEVREVKTLVNDIAGGIAQLLHVAEIHEQRLSRLEER